MFKGFSNLVVWPYPALKVLQEKIGASKMTQWVTVPPLSLQTPEFEPLEPPRERERGY